jgi:hypothetical protein
MLRSHGRLEARKDEPGLKELAINGRVITKLINLLMIFH